MAHDPLIGFIGNGNMGGAIAAQMLAKGLKLVTFDSSAEASERMRRAGAEIASSPRAVADRATVVFACLPSKDASMAVATGPDGVIGGKAMMTYIESSTLGTAPIEEIARKMTAAGISMLDAPISGGPQSVGTTGLTSIVSGADAVVKNIRPILETFAGHIFVVGDKPGQAQLCKIVNNALSIVGMSIACEAVVMGVKAGLAADMLIDVINHSSGQNSATTRIFPLAVLPRRFSVVGPLTIGLKDIELYVEESRARQVETPMGDCAVDVWSRAVETLGAKQDWTAIIKYFEKRAGVELPEITADSPGHR
jgi:3-hydroxyisobutyrate dehydrogenase-like beta-hydroxyacid dehydrogenase